MDIMDTTFSLRGSTLTAELAGEIDHHCCDRIRNDIDSQIGLYEAKHLILDFSKVTFMDSSGIGMVLGRYKKMKERGGTVTIRGAGRLVKQILDMSGVFSLMDCEDSEDDKNK